MTSPNNPLTQAALILLMALQFQACGQVTAVARIAVEGVEEAIEVAARVSGRSLTPAARTVLATELRQATLRYGDDALVAASRGGLELAEAAGRYGSDVWKFSVRVPAGARALALHADELLPLARRIGPEVLELEARHPAIACRAAGAFGDDAVRYLAREAPAAELPRLVGYAERADSPATRKLLLDAYKEKGSVFLERLDWKVIMAGGLSTAAVVAAYKVSDGVQDGLETVAKGSPGHFARTVGVLSQPVRTVLTLFGLALAAMLLWRLWPWVRRLTPRPKPAAP